MSSAVADFPDRAPLSTSTRRPARAMAGEGEGAAPVRWAALAAVAGERVAPGGPSAGERAAVLSAGLGPSARGGVARLSPGWSRLLAAGPGAGPGSVRGGGLPGPSLPPGN